SEDRVKRSDLLDQAQPFVIGHEEGLIAPVVEFRNIDRTADFETKLVLAKRGFRGAGLLEVIARVQHVVAKELEERAVQIVGAGFGNQVQMRAEIRPVLRRIRPGLNFEFLNGIDGRMERSSSDQVVYNRNSVKRDAVLDFTRAGSYEI